MPGKEKAPSPFRTVIRKVRYFNRASAVDLIHEAEDKAVVDRGACERRGLKIVDEILIERKMKKKNGSNCERMEN